MSRHSRRRRRRRRRGHGGRGRELPRLDGVELDRPGPSLLRVRVRPEVGARTCAGCLGMGGALLGAAALASLLSPGSLTPGQQAAYLILAPLFLLYAGWVLGYREETLLDAGRQEVVFRRGLPGLSRTRRRSLGGAEAFAFLPEPGGPDAPRSLPRAALRFPDGDLVLVGPPRRDRNRACMDAAALRGFLEEHLPAPAGAPAREPAPLAAPGDWYDGVAPFGPADCPLCREALQAAAPAPQLPVVACRACQTGYHAACAEELGRCAVLGCRHADRRERARAR